MAPNRRLYRREEDEPPNKIENLARFAVEEHNRHRNSTLQFGKVISVRKQVDSGILYDITLEAVVDGRRRNVFEAKVLEKPSMNFKELKGFKPISHARIIV